MREQQREGEEGRLSTMVKDTSATGSMGSQDPGGVTVRSEPSAEPSLAAAEAD